MYKTIYCIDVYNGNKKIVSYFYTDYDKCSSDAGKMAENRKKNLNVDYFSSEKSHSDKAATICYQFDDDISIVLFECGWAQDDNGKIRATFGADYSGNSNYKWFNTEKEFDGYIKLMQPLW